MDATELLGHAAELERRDELLAFELDRIDALADRVAALRTRAREVEAALADLPAETDAALAGEQAARAEKAAARKAHDVAERRIQALGRASGQDVRDQAGRELVRAREELHDAGTRIERAASRVVSLEDRHRTLIAETDALGVEARTVATGIQATARIADPGKGEPGSALASIEDWGARARAALFVAHGALAEERERIVLEANALGSLALGEPLGGSSVSLVRRRIEEALPH